jgi:opacity protein-like surface antigen
MMADASREIESNDIRTELAKFLLTDNVYVFAELTYYKYADLTLAAQQGSHNLSGKASSSAQNVLIGLGYKF